jgi:glycosyltransferase involved in cell wall biosynthesis
MAGMSAGHGFELSFASLPNTSFIGTLRAGRSVLSAVSRGAPDVIVIDSIAAAFLAPAVRMRRVDVPMVASLHMAPGGIGDSKVRSEVQRFLDHSVYSRMKRLIVASEALAETMVQQGFAADRIRVVPPGRDVAGTETISDADSENSLPDLRAGRRAAVLAVANWVPNKGILDLLDAFSLVPNELAVLHLAGDERADPDYGSLVKKRLSRDDLTGRVVVHGKKDFLGIQGLYRAADIFVLPSVVETYGTVYGEAMNEGLPIIGWNTGNLRNLIDDGTEGIIVDRGDIEGLAAAIKRLAQDDELRGQMGEAARRRASSRPTWGESGAAFYAAIREAL